MKGWCNDPSPPTEQKTRKDKKIWSAWVVTWGVPSKLLWLPLSVCCPCVMQCNASCKVQKTRELLGLGTLDVSETRMSLDSLSFPPSFLPSFSCTLSIIYLPSHIPFLLSLTLVSPPSSDLSPTLLFIPPVILPCSTCIGLGARCIGASNLCQSYFMIPFQ